MFSYQQRLYLMEKIAVVYNESLSKWKNMW